MIRLSHLLPLNALKHGGYLDSNGSLPNRASCTESLRVDCSATLAMTEMLSGVCGVNTTYGGTSQMPRRPCGPEGATSGPSHSSHLRSDPLPSYRAVLRESCPQA